MEQEHHRAFGPFHLDGPQGRLWQGDQRIALRPHELRSSYAIGTAQGRALPHSGSLVPEHCR
jgi:hypothetical protein